jgi:preprotein translocase subunit YajC
MELNLIVLFAPLMLIGVIFAVYFAIQDRKQAKTKEKS